MLKFGFGGAGWVSRILGGQGGGNQRSMTDARTGRGLRRGGTASVAIPVIALRMGLIQPSHSGCENGSPGNVGQPASRATGLPTRNAASPTGELPCPRRCLQWKVGQSAAELRLEVAPEQRVAVVSAPTTLQKRAFQLLGITPHPTPPAELLAIERTET